MAKAAKTTPTKEAPPKMKKARPQELKPTVPPILFVSDRKMLELMEWAVSIGLASSERDFLQQIGFTPNNISRVRYGFQSFTKEHIYIAAKVFGANLNWLFDLEPNTLRNSKMKTPKEMLRDAVAAVEPYLK
jgi:hypothetical protein